MRTRILGILAVVVSLLVVMSMQRSEAYDTVAFYLVPIETDAYNARGPAYLCWGDKIPPDCIPISWSMMDYGFSPLGLVAAKDLTPEQKTELESHADVFRFPDNLDTPVDQDVQAWFEGVNLPTDWLTPATTWRELMRQVAGMFMFNQRYMGIAAAETGELHSIWDTATLSTRLRQMTEDEQRWFLLTVDSFGFDSSLISTNSQLRLLVRQAGDYWAGQTFYLGGAEF